MAILGHGCLGNIHEKMEYGIEKAPKYQFTLAKDIFRFIDTMLIIDPEFDSYLVVHAELHDRFTPDCKRLETILEKLDKAFRKRLSVAERTDKWVQLVEDK